MVTVEPCIILHAYSGQDASGVRPMKILTEKFLWKQAFNAFFCRNLRMAELLLTMYFNEEYFFMDSLELVILHKKRNNDIISDNPVSYTHLPETPLKTVQKKSIW